MTDFLVTFLLLLFTASFFCSGWYVVTRGYYVKTPDEKIKTEGMIFGFWERFFEAKVSVKKVFYLGDEALKKFNHLLYLKPSTVSILGLKITENGFVLYNSINDQYILEIEKLLDCKVKVFYEQKYIMFYKEEDVYRFPELVRMPVSQCPICYASFYGSAIYLSFLSIQKHCFDWTFNKNIAYFVFYIIFIVSLAFFNKILSKYV